MRKRVHLFVYAHTQRHIKAYAMLLQQQDSKTKHSWDARLRMVNEFPTATTWLLGTPWLLCDVSVSCGPPARKHAR